jgi:hypothetical protein
LLLVVVAHGAVAGGQVLVPGGADGAEGGEGLVPGGPLVWRLVAGSAGTGCPVLNFIAIG